MPIPLRDSAGLPPDFPLTVGRMFGPRKLRTGSDGTNDARRGPASQLPSSEAIPAGVRRAAVTGRSRPLAGFGTRHTGSRFGDERAMGSSTQLRAMTQIRPVFG